MTVGVPLGCMAGISVTVAAAKPLGLAASEGIHSAIYYAAFLGMTGWALLRGAPRASIELIPATMVAMLLVPLASLYALTSHPWQVPVVDLASLAIAGGLWFAWRSMLRRAQNGPRDSVWSLHDRKTGSGQGASDRHQMALDAKEST